MMLLGGPSSIRFILVSVIAFGGQWANGLAETYWVSDAGSDTAMGTSAAPFRTITHALTLATNPGDTVFVKSGTYRNEKAVFAASGEPGNPITLEAAPGERPMIKGSEILSNWTLDDSAGTGRPIYRAPWSHFFGAWDKRLTADPQDLTRDVDANNRGRNQLFVNGEYVEEVPRQVDLRPGSFFIDQNKQQLFLWVKDDSSPEGKLVEGSNTEDALIATRGYDHLVIRGLSLEHCANKGSLNAAVRVDAAPGSPSKDWSDGILVEDLQVRHVAGTAIGIWRSDSSVIRNCVLTDNGQSGLLLAGCKNSLVSGGQWLRNNTLAGKFYNHGHEAVGKIASCEDTIVEGIESAYNRGFGMWVDGPSNRRITLRNNRVHDNGVPGANTEGIRVEIAYLVDVYNNTVYKNDVGISIDTSAGCRIFNNTVVFNQSTGIYCSGVRKQWDKKFGEGKYQRAYGNRLFNNLLAFNQQAHNRRGYVVSFDVPDPNFNPPDFPDTNGIVPFSQNWSDFNLFFSQAPRGGSFFVNSNGDKTGAVISRDLGEWQEATASEKWDLHSTWGEEPLFLDVEKEDYRLAPGSPGIGAGSIPKEMPEDGLRDASGQPREPGKVDLGAFQAIR